jgi:ribose 5-phosphate isomerase B
VEALRQWGVDIRDIRSQPLTDELVEWATHIYAMTRGHLDAILTFFPEAANKVWLACEFEPALAQRPEVPDPIGMGIHAYIATRDHIFRALNSLVTHIDSTDMTEPTAAQAPTETKKALRVAIGADHGGYEVKQAIREALKAKGIVVHDLGTNSAESVDYPDFAGHVCHEVLSGDADFGILVCKTGIGMSIAANRHAGNSCGTGDECDGRRDDPPAQQRQCAMPRVGERGGEPGGGDRGRVSRDGV